MSLLYCVNADRWMYMDGDSAEHTVRLILRPSVTSSGRILRNSKTQSPASFPSAEPTVANTFFHVAICIARLAKLMHSWVCIGLGPDL
jgi:hypothetical protein